MCNNISNKTIITHITKKYEEPLYMNKARNIYPKNKVFSFKVTYNIKHSDYFIIAD